MHKSSANRKKFVDDWYVAELRYVNYGADGPLKGMQVTFAPDGKSSRTDTKWVMANVLRMRRQGKMRPAVVD